MCKKGKYLFVRWVCLWGIISAAEAAFSLYNETLGNGSGISGYCEPLSSVQWSAFYSPAGAASPDTVEWTEGFTQGHVALLTDATTSANPYYTDPVVLWTSNFTASVDIQDTTGIQFVQNNSSRNGVVPHLVLCVDGNWFVSEETFEHADNATVTTDLDAARLAEMNWYELDFIPGITLSLNAGSSISFVNLHGTFECIGLFYEQIQGRARLRELEITAGHVLREQDVFWQGMNGYDTFRIPALISAPDGTVLAFAEGRVNSSSDTGNINLVLRRSFDKGETWDPLQVVWNDSTNTCGNPTVLVDQETDRVWLFMTHNLGQDSQSEITAGTSDGVRTVWSCCSDDNGASWSAPVNRFNEVQAPDTRWDATGPGNGIQLRYGALGRLVVPAINRNIQSDDHGATWYAGASLPDGTSEATIAELNDGRLLHNGRPTGSFKNYRRRITAISDDVGSSWSPLQVRYDLFSPVCQGSMITHVKGGSDDLVLFSNPSKFVEGASASSEDRWRMTVRKSQSNADVFEHEKILYPRHAAYSSLASLNAGELGILYENGRDWPYRRITFARFTPRWVEDFSLLLFNFEERSPGQWIPADPDAVLDSASYGFSGTATAPIEVVPGDPASGGGAAIRLTGEGEGIRISDLNSRGRLNIDRDMNVVIRAVFRTTSHSSGGSLGSGHLIGKDVGTMQPSWWLRVEDGKARFFIDDGAYTAAVRSDDSVVDGLWHEIVIIRDVVNRQLHMVHNGVLVDTDYDRTQEDSSNENDLVIGMQNNGSRAFVGDIDELEILIPGLDSPQPELLARYAFEGTLTDAAGTNDGVAVGASFDYVTSPLGGQAVDGQGDYIELPQNTAYPRAGAQGGLRQFTYMAWVRREAFSGSRFLFGLLNDGTTSGVQLSVNDDGSVEIFLREDSGAICSVTTPAGCVEANRWHHIAVTFDRANMRIFVDGNVIASSAGIIRSFSDWQYPMPLLTYNNRGAVSGSRFLGQVDELRIYNSAMSPEQVRDAFCAQWYAAMPMADDNADGVSDLVGYALGVSIDEDAGPYLPMLSFSGQDAVLFNLLSSAQDNVVYEIWASEDLSAWELVAEKTISSVWKTNPSYTYVDDINLFMNNPGLSVERESPAEKGFWQLRVGLPPETDSEKFLNDWLH